MSNGNQISTTNHHKAPCSSTQRQGRRLFRPDTIGKFIAATEDHNGPRGSNLDHVVRRQKRGLNTTTPTPQGCNPAIPTVSNYEVYNNVMAERHQGIILG